MYMYIYIYIYTYAITCIHWYFDSYINITQKASVHIGVVILVR